MNTVSSHEYFEFEHFRLDPRHMLLSRNSERIDLAPKVIEMLVALVKNNGTILDKDELMEIVWPGIVVDESNIFQNLYLLRKTLGNKADGAPFIETLRRRGYRFSADVRVLHSPDSQTPAILLLSKTESVQRPDRQFSNGGLIICAAVLLCFVVTGVASVFYRPWGGISVEANSTKQLPASIAVLPFRAFGADAERVSQGICDALITRLGNENRVAVRPTSAVRKFTDPDRDSVEIGRMQGVEAVLDGSIQKDGERVRVNVQLIDTLSGVTIWSARFDARDTNILDVQDNISERVTAEMTRSLGPPN